MKLIFICLVLMLASAWTAAAQEVATSFYQLQVLVEAGDVVRITDVGGNEIRGTIAELTPSSLALLVDGTRRDLAEAEVLTIRQRRRDSLHNGVLWGLGIGAGLAVVRAATGGGCDGQPVVCAPIGGAIGSGIGAAVDAVIQREDVIYAKGASSAASVTIWPAVSAEVPQQSPVDSFDQLQLLVRRGDIVTVTGTTGQAVRGRIVDMSSSSLVLLAAGMRLELQEHDVATVRERRPDPLKNGALWGLGVGAAGGLILSGIACAFGSLWAGPDAAVSTGCVLGGTLIVGGIGTGIGVGVDALIQGDQVIYARSPKRVLLTLRLTK